jgi:putative FmdB family regulatory protein
MPIYEYVCRDCGHQFEWLTHGDTTPECPSCGRNKLSRMLSVPSAHVAGATQPRCPMEERRSCNAPNCCGGGCQFDQG